MNNIIKEKITIVQNSEGAIFKIGDIIVKAVKGRTNDFTTPSKILSFNHRVDKKDKTIITAITDFKYKSGKGHQKGILIDKIELYNNPFPKCFKIRSLGDHMKNHIFIEKLNMILSVNKFSGSSHVNSYYFLNLNNKIESGCGTNTDLDPKFIEVTIEQFLKYCEYEKI
jgi:hypothetical protein